jgi:hypothetical protein
MLSFTMLAVIMLNVIKHCDILLNVIKDSVILLSVVALSKYIEDLRRYWCKLRPKSFIG